MKNRSAYAFTLLLVLSCGDNPSDPGNIPYGDFDIFIPNGDSQWMLWETGVPVEYDVTAIQDSYLIKLELVKNDTLTTDFGDWVFNTGSATVKAQVPDTLGMGNNYRLRILTVEGDTAYSASFSIQGYSLGEFVEVPAGSFLMGSLEEEWYHQPSEAPAHTVTFENSFEILGNEVMQSTWENVMGNNPSNWGTDSFPVESVSWNDCQVFVETLSAMDSLYNYRLPSEAEWEYACRAGTTTAYSFGNDARKLELGRRILKQWVDECYIIGIMKKKELAIVANNFGNFPDHMIQSYRLMALTTMFEATGDSSYLDKALRRIEVVLKRRDDARGVTDELRHRSLAAWSSLKYTKGSPYAWIVHAGMISYPIARWVYLVRRDPVLSRQYAQKAEQYLQAMEELWLSAPHSVLSLLIRVGRLLAGRGIKSYLVGGWVRDQLLKRATADIDIAVEGVDAPERFFKMYGEAEKLTGFPLDLLDINRIEPEFADIIKQKGVQVYEYKDK